MSEPTKAYAVVSGEHSDYQVHAIYRRIEDAAARVRANNDAPALMVDGVPTPIDEIYSRREDDSTDWWYEHVSENPAREETDEMRVEAFDYYEGEPTPAEVRP